MKSLVTKEFVFLLQSEVTEVQIQVQCSNMLLTLLSIGDD